MHVQLFLGLATVFAAIIVFIYAYGFTIVPKRLSITRLEVYSPSLPESFEGVTLLQFSDTHLGPQFTLPRLRQLVDVIQTIRPDIVVFTGDLHDAGSADNIAKYDPSPLLADIQAPLGKYAVYGNHDFGYGRKTRSSGSFLSRAGFKMLVNEREKITLPGGDSITIAGLDDYVLGKPNAESTLSKLDKDGFNILLAHEPDVADRLTRFPVDLQLSGHSHGGQVSLPLVGALVRTRLGRKYLKGKYLIHDSQRKERPYLLYVNRGIGTTRIPIRIGSDPELAVFTLRGSPSNSSHSTSLRF
ncbi:metallophosphoesterase [Cohnella herbarum]|uniref:Metallophosphoesterase n=1 Tax=Cohnella herbarum TaxID=2728023 RepID=A0A7Z2VFF2_9BACL|nr:metallophosphoesterase [Cohnella herbarum]QJD82127.1 metallophosphoesterase [Cohnella herbarum]